MSDDKRENIDEAEAVDATTAAPGSGAGSTDAKAACSTEKEASPASTSSGSSAPPAAPAALSSSTDSRAIWVFQRGAE